MKLYLGEIILNGLPFFQFETCGLIVNNLILYSFNR